jgi:hypothetical protein
VISRNIDIGIHRTIILPVASYGSGFAQQGRTLGFEQDEEIKKDEK